MSRLIVSTTSALLAASTSLAVAQTNFDSFTPMPGSVPAGSLPEATPFQLGNPAWTQVTIADRTTQLGSGQTNSGAWDMITANETGPNAGRRRRRRLRRGATRICRGARQLVQREL